MQLGRKVFLLSLALVVHLPSSSQARPSGTTPFVLDGNRMYAQVAFVRPDGTLHKSLVFVDLGSPSMILSETLFKELHPGPNRPLTFRVGDITVTVDSKEVTTDSWLPYSIGDNGNVEGLLPAGVLQNYQVVMDYADRTLTLAKPGTLQLHGTAVPLRLSEKTGLVAVDAVIDGKTYPITLDSGSAYSWLRKSTALDWLRSHPEWQRGTGAVGLSNMRMADDGIEANGTLLRVSEVQLGSLRLQEVGALAIGPSKTNWDFMDWYSQKNPVPVIGWLGGNVLRNFRIMIDYPKRVSFWLQQGASDPHDLDQVGLTLEAKNGQYFVAGIATKNGKPAVDGAQAGDKLMQIDGMRTDKAAWSAIYAALHGRPGEPRILGLERNGKEFQVRANVTAF